MSEQIEGRNAVLEAFRSGRCVDKLFILDGCQDGPVRTIAREARKKDTIINYVSKERLDQLSETRAHQGVIAQVAAYEYSTVEEILEKAEEKGEPPFLVLLDNVEDPHNLGAIIRTANLAGAHGVIIPKRRSVGLTSTVAKTSAGALNYTPVAKVTNLVRTIEELKEKGLFEKTIIVVLSDHGDYCGEYGLIRKGVGLSESLTRIPMVWAGYQIKKQPKAIDAHVSLADLFPTFCTAIGDSIPVGVQGRSLWPMLTGKEYPKEEFSSVVVQLGFGGEDVPLDDSLTFEQEGALGPNKVAHFDELNTWTQSGTSRMVRMGDWKLIMNSYGKGELYNLKKDPYEINNLFGNPKLIDKQSELLTKLLAWELRLQDPLPLPRHRYHFKRNPYNYHFTD